MEGRGEGSGEREGVGRDESGRERATGGWGRGRRTRWPLARLSRKRAFAPDRGAPREAPSTRREAGWVTWFRPWAGVAWRDQRSARSAQGRRHGHAPRHRHARAHTGARRSRRRTKPSPDTRPFSRQKWHPSERMLLVALKQQASEDTRARGSGGRQRRWPGAMWRAQGGLDSTVTKNVALRSPVPA